MADLTDIRGAEYAIDRAIWKLEALSDIFSALSSINEEALHRDSFLGISQIMRDEIDIVKRNVEVISTCHGVSGN